MLVELAIGDAYGAGYEFASLDVIMRRDRVNLSYVPHPKGGLPAGSYTDDTQMSISLAELVVDGVEITRESAADKFVEVFKRDPRNGYAERFQALLESVSTGSELLAKIKPDSIRNGAMMRAIPLGALRHFKQTLDAAEAQARVTHDTAEGVLSAQIIAGLAWEHLHGYGSGPAKLSIMHITGRMGLQEWLRRHFNYDLPRLRPAPVACNALQTLDAVLWVLSQEWLKSLSEQLTAAVDIGGDTDSVAALVLGLSHLAYDGRDDLQYMRAGLEPGNSSYGLQFLEQLDQRWWERAVHPL